MKHFDFSSEGTMLGDALEGVLPIFQDSRDSNNSSSTSTVLQLLFIVSDARIDSDNRQRLERTIRKYAEEHILVVFILLDLPQGNPAAGNNVGGGGGAVKKGGSTSVFDMKTVDFTPEGKIVSRDYMSEFPFPFYIAIQHIETIPEVLTGALKQWFEMMTRQNS
jgi:midasin